MDIFANVRDVHTYLPTYLRGALSRRIPHIVRGTNPFGSEYIIVEPGYVEPFGKKANKRNTHTRWRPYRIYKHYIRTFLIKPTSPRPR